MEKMHVSNFRVPHLLPKDLCLTMISFIRIRKSMLSYIKTWIFPKGDHLKTKIPNETHLTKAKHLKVSTVTSASETNLCPNSLDYNPAYKLLKTQILRIT